METLFAERLLSTIPSINNFSRDEFIDAHIHPPVISVRSNRKKISSAFLEERQVPWCQEGRYLADRPNFTADPLLHAGCYYVQEASSMFLDYAIRSVVDTSQNIIALDACAAPGGKTTLLSNVLSDESCIIANEVIQTRVGILQENCAKWGSMNTWISQNDPSSFTSLTGLFDLILVDAPCSGSGLFRKLPDYQKDWDLDMVAMCAQRQKRIIQDILPSLREGGIFIYMTCSFCQQENEDIVDAILQHDQLASLSIPLPDNWGIVETQSKTKKGFGYRFFPHLVEGEGFFLACFKKLGDNNSSLGIYANHFNASKYTSLLTPYLPMEGITILERKEELFAIHAKHAGLYDFVEKHLRLMKRGVRVGKIIRNELIPDHELALCSKLKNTVPAIELSLNEALRYLKKETNENVNVQKGWYVIRYKEHSLGWIKHLGNRMNNYYPTNYRILSKNILTS